MRYDPEIISKNIARNKKIKKVLFVIAHILLIPTVLFSLILIASELGNSNEVPSFFNISMYTVASASMEPRLSPGDIILVRRGYEEESYKEGNIITFVDSNNKTITHRIEEVKKTFDSVAFVTKGDANAVVDNEYVKYKDVIGKVIYTVPYQVAWIIKILQNRIVFIILIIILIIIVIYDGRIKERKVKRKMEREERNKKSDFYF